MKVLMIGPFPPPIHGMSKANEMLFNGLKDTEEVDIIDTNTESSLRNLSSQGKIDFYRLLKSLFQVTRGVLKILFKNYDVIYLTPSQTSLGFLKYTPFMITAKLKKVPYVIHIHGGYFRKMYDSQKGWKRRIIRYAVKNAAGAIVLGPSLKYMFEGLLPDEKIFVCPNGVEDEIIATEEEINKKIQRWKNDDTIRIVYLSNLMKTKGILELFEAIRILKKKGYKVHLDVAGAIEPEIEEDVGRYLEELKDVVTYHGVVTGKKKKELLLNNYIFCLPTYHPMGEGQPISILEAMANGCVIVTTKHGGIPDIVEDGVNGVFCQGKNSADLSAKISLANLKFVDLSKKNFNKIANLFSSRLFVQKLKKAMYSAITKYNYRI